MTTGDAGPPAAQCLTPRSWREVPWSRPTTIIAVADAPYTLIRAGRWWRQLQPPKRKKRGTDKVARPLAVRGAQRPAAQASGRRAGRTRAG
jgi:hypothetical protein